MYMYIYEYYKYVLIYVNINLNIYIYIYECVMFYFTLLNKTSHLYLLRILAQT
jgi:hypothetical protein